MADKVGHTTMESLMRENTLLRERTRDLARKLRESSQKSQSHAGDSRLFELVKQKDKALSEYAGRMEQKARELESLVQELNRRNDELSNGMAVLRLYQMMFENEPAGIVGVDCEGLIIQFNSSAVRFFGVRLHALRLQSIGELQIDTVDGKALDLSEMFKQTSESGEETKQEANTATGVLRIHCYCLEDISGRRGVVFRVTGNNPDE